MKRIDREATAATADVHAGTSVLKGNGHGTGNGGPVSADLSVILASLQTMRDGDFSVRLPGYWTGLHGKIADTFNDIVAANQQMARELKRVGQAVGKEGRTTRAHAVSRVARRLGRDGGFGQHAGGGPASTDDGSDARHRAPWRRET